MINSAMVRDLASMLRLLVDTQAQEQYWRHEKGKYVPPPIELLYGIWDVIEMRAEMADGVLIAPRIDTLLLEIGQKAEGAAGLTDGTVRELLDSRLWQEIVSMAGVLLASIEEHTGDTGPTEG